MTGTNSPRGVLTAKPSQLDQTGESRSLRSVHVLEKSTRNRKENQIIDGNLIERQRRIARLEALTILLQSMSICRGIQRKLSSCLSDI